jgi:hypothetical protein
MSAIQIESNEYELNRVKKEHLVLCDSNWIKRVWIELSQKRTPHVVMSAIRIE